MATIIISIIVVAATLSGCVGNDNPFIPDIESERPTVQTQSASNITDLSATLNAIVSDNGGASIYEYGFYFSQGVDPKAGTRLAGTVQGNGFSAIASSLASNTTYYFQAYAINKVGTGYGQVVSFVTAKSLIQVTVQTKANDIKSTFTTAILAASLSNPDNLSITQKGFLLGDDADLSSGKRNITVSGDKFQVEIDGLQADTKYFFCAYAKTSLGISYGDTLSLKTAVFQLEGDYYHSVVIGSQTWLVENLHVTKFRNGDPIPNVKDAKEWYSLSSPAYCAYDNNEAIADTCGYLYNHFVVRDSRGLGPKGWKVPSDDDNREMVYYLGGQDYYVAMALMSMTGWNNLPSQEDYNQPTNSTGFTAQPSGGRRQNLELGEAVFVKLGTGFTIWSTFYFGFGGEIMEILSEHPFPGFGLIAQEQNGFSVRLVKDE